MAQKVSVIAHRGASGTAPENTLASFRRALDAGADMIELDIHLTKDGQLAVIHDKSINRTTNGKGKIKDMKLDELKKYDAGSWFGSEEYKGETIPSLDEVMELVNGRCSLLIEIKGNYRGIVEKLVSLIHSRKAESWCIVQSFHSRYLRETKLLHPALETHQLILSDIPFLPLYIEVYPRLGSVFNIDGVRGINIYWKYASLRYIKKVHARGMKVFCWTVNEPDKMKMLIDKGVDGIITNYPERLKSVIGN